MTQDKRQRRTYVVIARPGGEPTNDTEAPERSLETISCLQCELNLTSTPPPTTNTYRN